MRRSAWVVYTNLETALIAGTTAPKLLLGGRGRASGRAAHKALLRQPVGEALNPVVDGQVLLAHAEAVARAGQVQLLQPVLTVAWSALLLGEHVGAATVVAALLVGAIALLSRLTR